MWHLVHFNEYRIRIDESNAITPPNLLGIDRRMAYANRKYHSGWMCVDVTNGLASMKLSGSLNKNGYCKLMIINIIINKMNPYRSFNLK